MTPAPDARRDLERNARGADRRSIAAVGGAARVAARAGARAASLDEARTSMAADPPTPTSSSARGCARAPRRRSASPTRWARRSAARSTSRRRSRSTARQPVPVTVRLRGPADVVGIDPHQIVRMDPRPGTADFEPNYFAAIEFDRPDFPWLFTPAAPTRRRKLRPWLCLVVVRKQDGVALRRAGDAPLPVLESRAPAQAGRRAAGSRRSWAGRMRRRRAAKPASTAARRARRTRPSCRCRGCCARAC